MKTVLFVPGFREGLTTKDYTGIMGAMTSKGYAVTFVPISWKRTLLDDWSKELDAVYAELDPKTTILAGFSYGAMAALQSAAKKNPAELWLFSLSPYFSDDMPHVKRSWLSSIGHRRVDDFKKLDFNDLAKNIKCKTLIVVGETEAKKHPLIGNRSEVAHKTIKGSTLVVAPHANHDVTEKVYVDAVREAI